MGRKIPTRKHHGIRDPQRAIKQNGPVNNPPTEDYKPSKKFAEFTKLISATKRGKKVKKLHGLEDKRPRGVKKNVSSKLASKPSTKKMINETDQEYIARMNRITQQLIAEANYGVKHGISITRQPGTGAIALQKKVQHPTNKKEKASITAEIKKKLLEKKAEKKALSEPVKEYQRETIGFGEVVTRPPSLKVPPRLSKISETISRPGKKNLLLKSLLQSESVPSNKTHP